MILSLLSRRLAWSGFAVISLALFTAGPAQATLIDSFDTSFNPPQTSIFASPDSPGTAVVNDPDGIIGGQREMVLTVEAGTGFASVGGNSGAILQAPGSEGTQTLLQLTQNGSGGASPRDTSNFTGLRGISLNGTNFLSNAMSDSPTPTFRVFTDESNFSEGVLITPPTGRGRETFGIPFSDFTAGTGAIGAANVSSIGAIRVDFNVSGSHNFIQTGETFSVAPEPGSWALVGLGALGMIGYSRFRRRKPPIA